MNDAADVDADDVDDVDVNDDAAALEGRLRRAR